MRGTTVVTVLAGVGVGFLLGRWTATETHPATGSHGDHPVRPRSSLVRDTVTMQAAQAPVSPLAESKKGFARPTWKDSGLSHAYAGIPRPTTYPNPIRVLENTGYVIGYDSVRMNPAWSAYRLFQVNVTTSPPRPDSFFRDTRTRAQVGSDAYRYSGYDRGHLAPSYGIATRYGVRAQYETFLMSNIVPQTPGLNRKLWMRLEQRIARQYAMTLEEVWVVTGPIYDNSIQRLASSVEIPDAFFKIVLDEDAGRPRALAFQIPQNVLGNERSCQFLTDVDRVEEQTGLDFYRELPDALEDRLEAAQASQLWGESAADASAIKVFITATGKRYHYQHCRYAKAAFSSVSIADAKRRGLTACKVCQPPL